MRVFRSFVVSKRLFTNDKTAVSDPPPLARPQFSVQKPPENCDNDRHQIPGRLFLPHTIVSFSATEVSPMKKILLAVVVLLLLIPIGLITYLNVAFPKDIPAPAITASKDPAVIAHGEYLANHVLACVDCHSDRNWTARTGPVVPGTIGKGGQGMEPEVGDVVARNITPFALADWSDGEIARAIACGLDRDGVALSPSMPYMEYNTLYEEDLVAVVSYIRTLAPIDNTPRDSKYSFPFSLILKTMPKPYEPMRAPSNPTPIERGEYLVSHAGCQHCHTPFEKGKYDESMRFAGGHKLVYESTNQISPNITMDPSTGIGSWNEQSFIAMFRAYGTEAGRAIPAAERGGPTIMPWSSFAGMTDEDLGAIWTFLQTVPTRQHDPEAAPRGGPAGAGA